MKFLILSLLVASVATYPDITSRVTGGTAAKAKAVACFAYLEIETQAGSRTCGGCLVAPGDKIITSASCVWTESEGKAGIVKIGLGQGNKIDAKLIVSEIYKNSAYILTSNTSVGDLAVLLLSSAVTTTATIVPIAPTLDEAADKYLGENLVACGYGVTDNKRTKTTKLMCTTLKVIAAAECAPPAGRRKRQGTAPEGIICTQNNDDSNVCGGDQGGPVFSNKTGTLQFVGVISYYLDSRPNARCQDGHKTVITQLGAWKAFVENPAVVT